MKLVVKRDDQTIPVEVERYGSGYRVIIDNVPIYVDVATANQYLSSLRLEDGRQFLIAHHRDGTKHEISFGDRSVHLQVFDPLALRRKRRDDEVSTGGSVLALMPGRVVRLLVEVGSVVEKGQGLLILEAMKMENEITASKAGVVGQLHVSAGQTVEGGAELLTLE